MNQSNPILLVDDEEHLLISLRDFLQSEGFEVATARSGEEALKRLPETHPALIILDISMPGMGGIGFLKAISGKTGAPDYPVIVLTARSQMEDFFGTLDVEGFFAKPADEIALSRKIRQVLERQRSEQERSARKHRLVLLAESDPRESTELIQALSHAGYDVEHVRSGPEVLEKGPLAKPDLFLMREDLDRLNGSAVAGLIQVMPSLAAIPVLIYHDGSARVTDRTAHLSCVKRVVNRTAPVELVNEVIRLLD